MNELKYQHEGEIMKANLQNYKVEQLIIKASVEYAKRIKDKECLYSYEAFQIYLQALADTIANSDQDLAFLLKVIQNVKDIVFGRVKP
jgi:hypothetical protein